MIRYPMQPYKANDISGSSSLPLSRLPSERTGDVLFPGRIITKSVLIYVVFSHHISDIYRNIFISFCTCICYYTIKEKPPQGGQYKMRIRFFEVM